VAHLNAIDIPTSRLPRVVRDQSCSVKLHAFVIAAILLVPIDSGGQANSELQAYFLQNIGLSESEIASIRNGQAVTKSLPSRAPAEVFLFGAVYIQAAPESYVKFAHDYNRLRKLPNNPALGVISDPPRSSDFKSFTFDNDEIKSLKDCKPSDCQLQLPASSIEEFQKSINWSAANVNDQVNQLLQKSALERLQAYQHEGNEVLGVYNDKRNPTEVSTQFAYMVSYSKALPKYLPEFYHYLLAYPNGKPANVENSFYWARVKFGLKPTLRVVHVLTMSGKPGEPIAFAIAEKQLYSSHYFETSLDFTFGVRGDSGPEQPGFYLIMVMGSEQAGLTGAKGSIVRKAAVSRSTSNLQKALTTIKGAVETSH
jgi:hypothetical protein